MGADLASCVHFAFKNPHDCLLPKLKPQCKQKECVWKAVFISLHLSRDSSQLYSLASCFRNGETSLEQVRRRQYSQLPACIEGSDTHRNVLVFQTLTYTMDAYLSDSEDDSLNSSQGWVI